MVKATYFLVLIVVSFSVTAKDYLSIEELYKNYQLYLERRVSVVGTFSYHPNESSLWLHSDDGPIVLIDLRELEDADSYDGKKVIVSGIFHTLGSEVIDNMIIIAEDMDLLRE